MIITERTASDAELDKVLDIIKKGALSPEGKENISIKLITDDRAVIERRAGKIGEYINLLSGAAPDQFPYISDLFDYAEHTHADFPGSDIYRAGEFLHSYISMLSFLQKADEIHDTDRELSEEILSSLDEEGNVTENHPRLLPLIRKRDAKSKRQRPRAVPMKKSPEESIRSEKMKILHELSDKVRDLLPIMKKMLSEVIDFDFHYSFALWARREKASHPQSGNTLSLIAARHPLLGKNAVPIDIALPDNVVALVLSGANAGGKTVTMKTVALLAMLNQISGYVTASESSVLPVYSSFFADIGDNQSILDSASTFSSHMKNIAEIARKADSASLVILDELGSGTDPEEGAALSRSILTYFSTHAALTLITSHYPEVKSFAYSEERMMNASMEFDERSGLPTYRVLEGIPGDSHAIATAKRSGMPKEITESASLALRGGEKTAGKIIQALISKERALDRKITEMSLLKKKLEVSEKELQEKEEHIRELESSLRKEGIKEINDYLRDSRKKLEKLVMEVRTGTLTKEKTKKVRTFTDSIEKKKEEEEELVIEEISDNTPLEAGDAVECGSMHTPGVVVSVSDDKAVVQLDNGLKMAISRSMIRHRNIKKEPEKASVQFSSSSRKAEYTMDVRGLTLEETLRRLDDQFEAAVLSGLSSFSIIHGYGDGILSRGIHEYLRKRRDVKDYRFALPEDGGMGKTYVEL